MTPSQRTALQIYAADYRQHRIDKTPELACGATSSERALRCGCTAEQLTELRRGIDAALEKDRIQKQKKGTNNEP